MLKTHVFIDGFNLYYGLLRGSPYKWLNLEAFCDSLLPKNRVERIYYFIAKVSARPHDLDQPARQEAYLKALGTLPRVEVHFGTFQAKPTSIQAIEVDPATQRFRKRGGLPVPLVDAAGQPIKSWVLKTEEKGSDVNLASYLLRDSFRGLCECAVVISNDSDLLTPIRMAKEENGTVIGLVPPRERGSNELKALADFKIDPRTHHLAHAQFPPVVNSPDGPIHKPATW